MSEYPPFLFLRFPGKQSPQRRTPSQKELVKKVEICMFVCMSKRQKRKFAPNVLIYLSTETDHTNPPVCTYSVIIKQTYGIPPPPPFPSLPFPNVPKGPSAPPQPFPSSPSPPRPVIARVRTGQDMRSCFVFTRQQVETNLLRPRGSGLWLI